MSRTRLGRRGGAGGQGMSTIKRNVRRAPIVGGLSAFLAAAGALGASPSAFAADDAIVSGDVRATAHNDPKNVTTCAQAGLAGSTYGIGNEHAADPDGVLTYSGGAVGGETVDVT